MSKRPLSTYHEDEPGRHIAVYAGRILKGHVVVRDDAAHVYLPEGSFAGTVEGLNAAREWLLNHQEVAHV